MKTIGTFLTLVVGLFLCLTTVQAQQNAPSENEKKIVITKRTIDADGTETTETIVKKGQAAEDFDVEQYIEENRADNVELDVRVRGGDDNERKVVIKRHKNKNKNAVWVQDLERNVNDAMGHAKFWKGHDHGFLGVRQKGNDDPNTPGVQVSIVDESGAKAAGLQDGDVLLKLNDAPINGWGDITRFMQNTKPDDKIQITYERGGNKNTVEATLSKSKETAFEMDFDSGDMDFDFDMDDDRQKDACLGVYTTASGEGDARGARITKFTDESAAQEAAMTSGDVITAVNGNRVNGHDQLWEEIAKYKVGDKVSVAFLRDDKPQQIEATLKACRNTVIEHEKHDFDLDIKVREKDACLGVYTTASGDGAVKGTRVTDFTKESAAREAQMATGDVITAVNGVQVEGHDALWDEIAKYNVGDKVSVAFLRGDQSQQIEATLKACRDNSSRVIVLDKDEAPKREFFLWNWKEEDQNELRRTQIITIRKGAEGDAVKLDQPAAPAAADRTLQLEGFRAFPNPAQGQVTVEFHSEPLPTIVSLLDMSGRQLFREELNAFSGDYYQQFDLSEYARGTVIIHVQQNGKVFTEQIIVN